MRKLTCQEKRLFVLIAVIIAFYFGKAYLDSWRERKSKKLTQSEGVKREKLIRILEKIRQSELLFEKKREYFTLFALSGTADEQINLIRSDLAQISKTIPIVIANIQQGDIQTQKALTTVSLQISADGTWPQISKLIYKLENTPYFFKIKNLSMVQNLSENSNLRIYLTLNRSYFVISKK